MRRILTGLIVLFVLVVGAQNAFARENVDYWYIKDFQSQIVVNTDSSLDITEYITADCGTAQKHGIFRVLPTTKQLTVSGKVKMPIELISITDFNDRPYKYQTTKNSSDNTITWKIGDADVFVTGENYYKIQYRVKNAILHGNSNFDEFYWNLSGNFWDIAIDHFKAEIKFPEEVGESNSELNIYSGSFGNGDTLSHKERFVDKNTLEVEVTGTMLPGEGITASLTFPKDIVVPYIPTFWEKNGGYILGVLFALIPIVILWLCFRLWAIHGKDPRINPTIAPEFEIPEDLCPIDMGVVMTDGSLKNSFITASIVNLAVKGKIKIKNIPKKGVFSKEDFELISLKGGEKISETDEFLMQKLFGSSSSVKISTLKNKFYKKIPLIDDKSTKFLASKKWIKESSQYWNTGFCAAAFVIMFLAIVLRALAIGLTYALVISSLIVTVFSFIMRSRTKEGAVLNRRIKGFKLYMNTAEKYRQKFNEKENIFERFLPYAILFGITKEWMRKMEQIYGEEYFTNYHPVWFIGSNFGSFNVDDFSTQLSAMSSNMSSTISSSPSSSGSGGGGFSGGGGGGGGGGGW